MGLISPTLPTIGDDRGSEEADVLNALQALLNLVNGSLDAANLAAAFFSPYRTISEATNEIGPSVIAGVYLPSLGTRLKSGLNDAGTDNPPVLIAFDPANYSLSGRTTRLRIVVATAVNATAPGINFTYGLYPITAAGAAATIAVTAGAVVSGSTVTRSAPAASSVFRDASADFAPPVAGVYALGVSTSGTSNPNTAVGMTLRLEYHYI
jgi:hypothetical protein